jgi:hypothetical protein
MGHGRERRNTHITQPPWRETLLLHPPTTLLEHQPSVGDDSQAPDAQRFGGAAHGEDVADVVHPLQDGHDVERPLRDDGVEARLEGSGLRTQGSGLRT